MAWNQPGNNGQDRDPWGSGNKGNSNGNNNGHNQGPRSNDLFSKINIMLGRLINNNGNNRGNNYSSNSSSGFGKVITFGIIAAVTFWGVSGFYTIQEGKVGVITRFGKVQKDFVLSGLHWKPTFIDNVHEVDKQGNRDFKTRGVMLTSDENVVQVEMSVVFQVEDPIHFLFNVTNAENSLRQASDSALRSTIGKYSMERILTDGKAQISFDTQKELVSVIANYNMGLKVIAVNLENARPPEDVKKAFDDAISAREDEQRTILESQRYTNRVIPEAEGNAAYVVANAKAYKEKVIREAEGEVEQFMKLLPEYKAAPEVTRARLYISTMERVMENTHKVLVSGNSSLMVLPLDKLMNQAPSSIADPRLNGSSTSVNTTSPTDVVARTVPTTRVVTQEQPRQAPMSSDIVRRGREL